MVAGMASFSVDEDLDKAWARTLDQCQEITKWNLKSTSRVLDIDNVINKIRPKTNEPELKDKAKDYLGKTLLCLQKFGSVIAQATSAVFGPSQQVMNGISFLIDATQEYGKVFSGLVTIMERMSAFLGRLKVYLDEKAPAGTPVLDKRLRSDVYEVLHHFIFVLAHSHKLATSKMARAKLMAGLLFFGDDQGVKESLANLEFKIANVSRMEITVILQKVSEEARNVRRVEEKVDVIVDGVTRIEASFLAEQDHRLTKEQNEQNARRLKETLQPDGPEAWVDVHNSFQSQIVANTGSWLLEKHAAFQRWTNPKENPPPVFVLSGGEGYGKSCLSSAVIHHLLDKYPKGRSDHRVAVAYYYFRRDAKEKTSVSKAVRDVLYQLTQYDTAYSKKVGSAIRVTQDLSKSLDLWRVFVRDFSNRANNTFFIVLDGVDEPESEEGRPLATIIQELMSEKLTEGQLQVRLFISGRPSEIRKIEDRSIVSIPEVLLGSKSGSDDLPINQADIVQFIASRLRNMDIFQTSANDEASALRDRIPNVLAAGVKGDFVRLGYKLDEISKCTRVRQIVQILDRASETREDAIQRQVTGINDTLSRDEIEDLNEILNWILGAMDVEAIGWVDSECLEGVLLLKTGTPAVVSLAKQIKTKYATLLDLDKQEFVTLVSDDIRQYLLRASRAIKAIQPTNDEVQVAEIAIVKRVISTFCGDDLYKRFNFEGFFESMGGEKAAKVQIDERDMHLKILRMCLVALCDKPEDKDLKSLREYARMWFAEHLGTLDKEMLDPTTVRWVSTQLARLLVESGPIDAWWNEDYFDQLQDDWLDVGGSDDSDAGTEEDVDDSNARTEGNDGADRSTQTGTDAGSEGTRGALHKLGGEDADQDDDNDKDYIDIVAAWLKDSPIEGIGLADRSWLIEILGGLNPRVLLLKRVLVRLAGRWFEGPRSFSTYTCINRLYCQIYQGQKASKDGPSLDDIEAVITWARNELPHIKGDAQWAFRAAVTYKNCSYFEAAITSSRKCLDEEPDHWRARLCLAQSLDGNGQTVAACKCYQKLDRPIDELKSNIDPGVEELFWLSALPGLANCYVALGDLNKAAEIYQRVMDYRFGKVEDTVLDDPDDGQYNYLDAGEIGFAHAAAAATQLISVWHKQENFKAIHTLLYSLDRKDTGYTSTRLTGVIQHSASDHSLHEQLRSLVIDTGTFSLVNTIYSTAVTVDENEHLDRLLALRHYWAMLNWLHGSLADCQERSFEIWKDNIETEIPDDADAICFQMRTKACKMLPEVLLHRAKELQPGSEEASACIKLLEFIADKISSITDDRNEDPELSLARYYHLADDQNRAKATLAKRMRAIFKDWDESSYGFYQHLLLAHTFTALDDEGNALAAWSLLAPYAPEPPVAAHKQNAVTSDMDTANVDTDDDDQATPGAERDSDTNSDSDSQSSNTVENGREDQDSDNQSSDHPEESSEPSEGTLEPYSELYGWLNSSCDGCGSSWSYVDDIYCCKDCLDVQLDKKCYPKLRAGQLDRTICHPNHSFLHVPPFDEEKWRSLVAKDAVEVDGTEMSRLDWLAGVRAAWGVERETLEREEQEQSAVTIIGQGWKAYQARRSGT